MHIQIAKTIVLAQVLVAFAYSSQGAGFPTREEVLREVFPAAGFKAERVFLTGDQKARAEALSGIELPTSLIARYRVFEEGKAVGRAYVDTHTVRTKKQSLLICLDANGRIRRVEVTAFLEPPEYQVPGAWFGQYDGKQLSADLRLQRDIRSVAGATLTSISSSQAIRRVLAIDTVLHEGVEE